MNLHLLHTGPLGVNTYILPLFENKVLIVDPADSSFSGDEGSVLAFLQKNKLEAQAILLTHGHFDHVAGLPALKKAFPLVPIAIHSQDKDFIGENSAKMQGISLGQMGFLDFLPYVSQLPSPDFFLEDSLTLDKVFQNHSFSEEIKKALSEWEVIHSPGHTRGSCCFYNKKELTLISGDTMFFHSWGRTDLIGGNEEEIHKSLLKILDYCDKNTKVYPGHDNYGFTLGQNF